MAHGGHGHVHADGGHGHVHVAPLDERPTRCPACGRATRTLGALCEACGAVKDPPGRPLAGRRGGLAWLLWYGPNLTLIAVAALVVRSTALSLAAAALLAVPLAWQVLSGEDPADHQHHRPDDAPDAVRPPPRTPSTGR